jgi:hypothetical protein
MRLTGKSLSYTPAAPSHLRNPSMNIIKNYKSRAAQDDIAMTDTAKPTVDIVDNVEKSEYNAINTSQEENAVGYKEYREALDLDITEKEVGTSHFPDTT